MNAKSLLPLLTALLIAPAAVPLLPTAPVRAQTTTEADAAALLGEGDRLLDTANEQLDANQLQEALQSYEQALEIYSNLTVQAAFPQESRLGEGRALHNLGLVYQAQGQYQQAIALYQQGLDIFREISDRPRQGIALRNLGNAYKNLGQYEQAIALYEQLLVIDREINNRIGEGDTLNELGNISYSLTQYQEAIEFYEQSLAIYRELGDRPRENIALRNLGLSFFQLNQYEQAIDFYEQSLSVSQAISDRVGEGYTLLALGNAYNNWTQYQQAIDFYDQGLAIFRELNDHLREGIALRNLGNTHNNLAQYEQAIEFYERGLVVFRELGDPREEANLLDNLASAYRNLEQHSQAINIYEQQILIFRELDDLRAEGIALNKLGNTYSDLGQYQQAIAVYNQSLDIAREVGNREGEGIALDNLGNIYRNLGLHQQAIDLYEQRLAVARDLGDREREMITLRILGSVSELLSNYPQALDFYQQSLSIAEELGDQPAQFMALASIGVINERLGDSSQARTIYQNSLSLIQGISFSTDYGVDADALVNLVTSALSNDDIRGLGELLNNFPQILIFLQQTIDDAREIGNYEVEIRGLSIIGFAHVVSGDFSQALTSYEQGLRILQGLDMSDRARPNIRREEAWLLGSIGSVNASLRNYTESLDYFQQSLAISQEIGDRAAEAQTLVLIGKILNTQDQPELAIVFYKQSVNVRESIRDDIRGLSQEQQQSFTDTIADDYRALADLLLQQNRILEAQRVLDLLRVQELDDYLDGIRSNSNTESGIGLRDPEQEINNRVIAVGYELAQLRDIPPNQLTDAQLQRLGELDTTQRQLSADFQGFLNSPEIQTLVAELDASLQEQDILARADEFINLQNNLRDIDQNAVMIYPLILEDRLELVLITPFSEPARYPVDVDAADLNAAILEFRQALTDRRSNPQPIAQQLYDWLMAPMQADLDAIGAETILYAPDGALRYVPLAALHDGDQWLIEQYRINHITAASLQDFTLRPTATPIILAAAFSDGFYEFEVGQRSFSFDGLPFAGVEVENLTAAFPNTTQFMNDRFSRALVEPQMDSHTIVHLATHASFVPDSPAESFILFGNGDRLTLQELNTPEWRGRFNNVELVVLSACETGVGGDRLGNGAEILGFGYLMQEAGAVAAIASLWQVSDGGTQVLMDGFYAALNNGYSKAEALQRAQIALITSDESVLAGERGNPATIEIVDSRTGQPLAASTDLAHPYYWAPFILIGNGL